MDVLFLLGHSLFRKLLLVVASKGSNRGRPRSHHHVFLLILHFNVLHVLRVAVFELLAPLVAHLLLL